MAFSAPKWLRSPSARDKTCLFWTMGRSEFAQKHHRAPGGPTGHSAGKKPLYRGSEASSTQVPRTASVPPTKGTRRPRFGKSVSIAHRNPTKVRLHNNSRQKKRSVSLDWANFPSRIWRCLCCKRATQVKNLHPSKDKQHGNCKEGNRCTRSTCKKAHP